MSPREHAGAALREWRGKSSTSQPILDEIVGRACEAAAADEREECAVVAETADIRIGDGRRSDVIAAIACNRIAKAIRARGFITPPNPELEKIAQRLAKAASPFLAPDVALDFCRQIALALSSGECDASDIEASIERRVKDFGIRITGSPAACAIKIWNAWKAEQ